MEKQFIDIAYDIARTKYGKKPFTFEQLWNDLVKKARLDDEEQKYAGAVYTAMLQDTRFIFAGKGQWKLREHLTLNEQDQLSNALYDFDTTSEEEGAEADAARKARASAKDEEDTYYDDETLDEVRKEAKQQALEDDDSDDEESEEESEEEDK